MSEAATDTNDRAPSDAARDESPEAVTEAAEQIVRQADVTPETAAAAKSTRKPKSTKKTAAPVVNVEALVDSMATLARTVETLSEKVEVSRELVQAIDRVPGTKGAPAEVEVAADPGEQPISRLRDVAIDFGRTIGYAAGIGLVAAAAGSDLGSSTMIFAASGVIAFLLSTFLTPTDTPVNGVAGHVRRFGIALLTVAGLGLTIGGVQYFGDEPQRAAKMIPIGLAVFSTAFVLRGKYRLASEQLVWVAGAGIWICLLMSIGLGQLAHSMDDKPSATQTTPDATTVTTVPPTPADSHATASTDAGPHNTTTTVAAAHGESSGHEDTEKATATTVAAASDAHAGDGHSAQASAGH